MGWTPYPGKEPNEECLHHNLPCQNLHQHDKERGNSDSRGKSGMYSTTYQYTCSLFRALTLTDVHALSFKRKHCCHPVEQPQSFNAKTFTSNSDKCIKSVRSGMTSLEPSTQGSTSRPPCRACLPWPNLFSSRPCSTVRTRIRRQARYRRQVRARQWCRARRQNSGGQGIAVDHRRATGPSVVVGPSMVAEG